MKRYAATCAKHTSHFEGVSRAIEEHRVVLPKGKTHSVLSAHVLRTVVNNTIGVASSADLVSIIETNLELIEFVNNLLQNSVTYDRSSKLYECIPTREVAGRFLVLFGVEGGLRKFLNRDDLAQPYTKSDVPASQTCESYLKEIEEIRDSICFKLAATINLILDDELRYITLRVGGYLASTGSPQVTALWLHKTPGLLDIVSELSFFKALFVETMDSSTSNFGNAIERGFTEKLIPLCKSRKEPILEHLQALMFAVLRLSDHFAHSLRKPLADRPFHEQPYWTGLATYPRFFDEGDDNAEERFRRVRLACIALTAYTGSGALKQVLKHAANMKTRASLDDPAYADAFISEHMASPFIGILGGSTPGTNRIKIKEALVSMPVEKKKALMAMTYLDPLPSLVMALGVSASNQADALLRHSALGQIYLKPHDFVVQTEHMLETLNLPRSGFNVAHAVEAFMCGKLNLTQAQPRAPVDFVAQVRRRRDQVGDPVARAEQLSQMRKQGRLVPEWSGAGAAATLVAPLKPQIRQLGEVLRKQIQAHTARVDDVRTRVRRWKQTSARNYQAYQLGKYIQGLEAAASSRQESQKPAKATTLPLTFVPLTLDASQRLLYTATAGKDEEDEDVSKGEAATTTIGTKLLYKYWENVRGQVMTYLDQYGCGKILTVVMRRFVGLYDTALERNVNPLKMYWPMDSERQAVLTHNNAELQRLYKMLNGDRRMYKGFQLICQAVLLLVPRMHVDPKNAKIPQYPLDAYSGDDIQDFATHAAGEDAIAAACVLPKLDDPSGKPTVDTICEFVEQALRINLERRDFTDNIALKEVSEAYNIVETRSTLDRELSYVDAMSVDHFRERLRFTIATLAEVWANFVYTMRPFVGLDYGTERKLSLVMGDLSRNVAELERLQETMRPVQDFVIESRLRLKQALSSLSSLGYAILKFDNGPWTVFWERLTQEDVELAMFISDIIVNAGSIALYTKLGSANQVASNVISSFFARGEQTFFGTKEIDTYLKQVETAQNLTTAEAMLRVDQANLNVTNAVAKEFMRTKIRPLLFQRDVVLQNMTSQERLGLPPPSPTTPVPNPSPQTVPEVPIKLNKTEQQILNFVNKTQEYAAQLPVGALNETLFGSRDQLIPVHLVYNDSTDDIPILFQYDYVAKNISGLANYTAYAPLVKEYITRLATIASSEKGYNYAMNQFIKIGPVHFLRPEAWNTPEFKKNMTLGLLNGEDTPFLEALKGVENDSPFAPGASRIAIKVSVEQIVEVLLQLGADTFTRLDGKPDRSGITPLERISNATFFNDAYASYFGNVFQLCDAVDKNASVLVAAASGDRRVPGLEVNVQPITGSLQDFWMQTPIQVVTSVGEGVKYYGGRLYSYGGQLLSYVWPTASTEAALDSPDAKPKEWQHLTVSRDQNQKTHTVTFRRTTSELEDPVVLAERATPEVQDAARTLQQASTSDLSSKAVQAAIAKTVTNEKSINTAPSELQTQLNDLTKGIALYTRRYDEYTASAREIADKITQGWKVLNETTEYLRKPFAERVKLSEATVDALETFLRPVADLASTARVAQFANYNLIRPLPYLVGSYATSILVHWLSGTQLHTFLGDKAGTFLTDLAIFFAARQANKFITYGISRSLSGLSYFKPETSSFTSPKLDPNLKSRAILVQRPSFMTRSLPTGTVISNGLISTVLSKMIVLLPLESAGMVFLTSLLMYASDGYGATVYFVFSLMFALIMARVSYEKSKFVTTSLVTQREYLLKASSENAVASANSESLIKAILKSERGVEPEEEVAPRVVEREDPIFGDEEEEEEEVAPAPAPVAIIPPPAAADAPPEPAAPSLLERFMPSFAAPFGFERRTVEERKNDLMR